MTEQARQRLGKEIEEFNARNQLQLFRLDLGEGLEFSGNIRFYFRSNSQEVAKVVRLTSNTTTTELVPILVDKYSAYIGSDTRHPELFNVAIRLGDQGGQFDERHLRGTECPLQLSLVNGVAPRFLLQRSDARRLGKTGGAPSTPQRSRDSLNSIGSGLSVDRSLAASSPAFNASQASRSQSSLNDSDSCSDVVAGGAMSPDITAVSPPGTPTKSPGRRNFIKSFRNTVMKKSSGQRPSSPRKAPASSSSSSSARPRVTRQESRRDSVDSMGTMLRVHSGAALLQRFNSDYKSVVITEFTTARQTVHAALQRYHLDAEDAGEYVLCDTVGRLEAYSQLTGHALDRVPSGDEVDADMAFRFVVHYLRLVNPLEHPLLLQRNWQPVLDCEQRFVLHPRRAVPAFRPTSPMGTTTESLSSRAGSLDALNNDDGLAIAAGGGGGGVAEEENAMRLTFTQRHSARTGRLTFTGVLADRVRVPFLVTVTCQRHDDSLLMYPLVDKVTTVGRWDDTQLTPDSGVCIALHGNDLQPIHCQIRCTEYTSGSSESETRRSYSLEPVARATVAVNGQAVRSRLLRLRDGDLVQIGARHAFIFRDPNAPPSESPWPWLPKVVDESDPGGNVTTTTTQMDLTLTDGNEDADEVELPDDVRHHPDGCETPDVAVSLSPRSEDDVVFEEKIAKRIPAASDNRDASRHGRILDTAAVEESSADIPSRVVSVAPATVVSISPAKRRKNGSIIAPPSPLETAAMLSSPDSSSPPLPPKRTPPVVRQRHQQPEKQSVGGNSGGPITPASQVMQSVAGQQRERKLLFRFSQASLLLRNAESGDQLADRFTFNLATERHEDKFLSIVIGNLSLKSVDTPLAPAVAVSLALQQLHRATEKQSNFRVNRFVNKLAEEIQEVVWQSTSRLDAFKDSFTSDGDPLEVLQPVLPALQELVTWMSNTLEILHTVHQLLHLRGEKVGKLSAGPPSSQPTHGAEALESLSLLQEVTVFAFQQILYPATKLLYVLLPSVLDENPFEIAELRQQMARSLTRHEYIGMSQVSRLVELLRTIMDLLYASQLHHSISYQLLSNLLFFTNASLFNTMMEDVGFYSWSKGMEIRANLDLLEKWAGEQPVAVREALRHLVQLSLAADLLSMPPDQLQTSTWSSLRGEFPHLEPSQLHRLLQNYQLPGNAETTPDDWMPTPDDRAAARSDKHLLISFASHPPLRIPNSDYTLSLLDLPSSCEVVSFLTMVTEKMAAARLPMTTQSRLSSPPTGRGGPRTERTPPAGGDSPELSMHHVPSRSSSNGSSDNSSNSGGAGAGAGGGVGDKAAPGTGGLAQVAGNLGVSSEYLSYSLGSLEAIEEADEPVTTQTTPAQSRKTSAQQLPGLPARAASTTSLLASKTTLSLPEVAGQSPRIRRASLPGDRGVGMAMTEGMPRKQSPAESPGSGRSSGSSSKKGSLKDVLRMIPSPQVRRAQIVQAPVRDQSDSDSDDDAREPSGGGTRRSSPPTRDNGRLTATMSATPPKQRSPPARPPAAPRQADSPQGVMSASTSMPEIQIQAPEVVFDAMADAVEAERLDQEDAFHRRLEVSQYSASVRSLHDADVDNLVMKAVQLLESDVSSSGSETSLNDASPQPSPRTLSPLAGLRPQASSTPQHHQHRQHAKSNGAIQQSNRSSDVVTVTLTKGGAGLGLGVVDGKLLGVSPGVYISSLVPGLAAHKCGQLKAGDKILAINGTNLMEATQDEAYRILRSGGGRVTIVAARNEEVNQMVSASSC